MAMEAQRKLWSQIAKYWQEVGDTAGKDGAIGGLVAGEAWRRAAFYQRLANAAFVEVEGR